MVEEQRHRRISVCNAMRARFTELLSDMYRKEVPLYGDLIRIVDTVNKEHFASKHGSADAASIDQLPPRHGLERHGAIRLGSPQELHTMRRLFSIFNMQAVGYYDLSVVGFPLHATAFRPLDLTAISCNPFRVFTTLLRHDLLTTETQELASTILARRRLFSDRLLKLIDKWEAEGPLSQPEMDEILQESLQIFKWHGTALASLEEYDCLKREHPIVADIVCFPTAHINHLTPRTWDIDEVQRKMIDEGIPSKENIEGPPLRECSILLRQTSFKALVEPVHFNGTQGFHTARFGEIEQRGAALTPKGKALYDRLLGAARQKAEAADSAKTPFDTILREEFKQFPDTWTDLQTQGLIFCRYTPTIGSEQTGNAMHGKSAQLSTLLDNGLIDFTPLTYEDFLPVSAAGIFTSNIGTSVTRRVMKPMPDQAGFEKALRASTMNEMELYQTLQSQSLEECRIALGLDSLTW
jgi:uncharacterized glyoxalase superfamily metalloenzyme YdcJ